MSVGLKLGQDVCRYAHHLLRCQSPLNSHYTPTTGHRMTWLSAAIYATPSMCAGIDTVISVVSGAGFGWQFQLIEAAKLAGVKTFVPSEFGNPLDHMKCALCLRHD